MIVWSILGYVVGAIILISIFSALWGALKDYANSGTKGSIIAFIIFLFIIIIPLTILIFLLVA